MFLLPLSMYWRIWISQSLVAGLLSCFFKILLTLLLLTESRRGKFQHRDAGQLLCRAPSTSCATAVQPQCGASEMDTKTPSNQPNIESDLLWRISSFEQFVSMNTEQDPETVQWFTRGHFLYSVKYLRALHFPTLFPVSPPKFIVTQSLSFLSCVFPFAALS